MAELVQDNRILPVLTRLMGCVESEITAAGIDTCFAGIVSGAMADSTAVTDEAMVWVRMGEVTPVVAEGRPNVMSCGVELQVTVEVGFLTCYPVDPDGDALGVDENLEITMTVNAALMALHRAINCCEWLAAPNGRKAIYDVTSWTPAGPLGRVVGGAWSVQIVV